MHKLLCLALLTCFFLSEKELHAQPKTTEEIKNYICQYKWFLRRFEMDGQYFTVPKDEQGTRMGFLSNGKMYTYQTGQNENDRPRNSWTLTKDKLSITYSTGVKKTFAYRFEDFIGYKIYTTLQDGEENPTYVWEQSDKIVASTSALPANGETVTNAIQPGTSLSSNAPHWYMLFTKGITMGAQAWVKKPNFSGFAIQDNGMKSITLLILAMEMGLTNGSSRLQKMHILIKHGRQATQGRILKKPLMKCGRKIQNTISRTLYLSMDFG